MDETVEAEERERVDMFVRQEGTTPVEAVKKISAMVVGVGAVGRQVSLMLAGMGVGEVILVDPDVVEERNIPVQLYRYDSIGWDKVESTAVGMEALNDGVVIYTEKRKFKRVRRQTDVVFCCVDSMIARQQIYDEVRGMRREDEKVETRGLNGGVGRLLVDGRMTAEVVRVLTMETGDQRKVLDYGKTLYSDENALPERCTYRMSVYGAFVCAGLMVGQFSRWVRNEWVPLPEDANKIPLEKDTILNLVTMDISRMSV